MSKVVGTQKGFRVLGGRLGNHKTSHINSSKALPNKEQFPVISMGTEK